jgi:uridine kinase
MEIPETIIEKIKSLSQPVLIGISGFGGSGKTTLAEQLGKGLNASVVGVDSFMIDRTLTDYRRWEIMDFTRLENEVLKPFTNNQNPISYGHFDWGKNGIVETREIEHNGYLIVEGVGLFRPELLKYFSYKIWIDCPLEEANERGKKRDREVHLNPQDEYWNGIWKENEKQYFSEFKPNEIADAVIRNY